MIGYAEAPQAWGRARGMARRRGVGLAAAVVEGWLSRTELGEIVGRCDACGSSRTCTALLASDITLPDLPGFCSNRGAIEALVP